MSTSILFASRRTFVLSVAFVVLLCLSMAASAQTETILYSFQGGAFDGANPAAGLISDAAGNFYGAAPGTVTQGVVFQFYPVGSAWRERILHTFSGPDGSRPQGGLVMDAHGNLFGTTSGGGNYGSGVVFELQPLSGGGWNFSVIYNFHFDGLNNFDGFEPLAALIVDKHGNLFGTTYFGGTGGCTYSGPATFPNGAPKGQIPNGCGTIFEVSPHPDGTWAETILYSFQGAQDGGLPFAAVVNHNGSLYGTTWEGGGGTNKNCGSFYDGGCGVVFSLTRNPGGTWTENVLYTFQGQTDGANPTASVVFDRSGNMFGTSAGANLSFNTDSSVFELSPATGGTWTETTIFAFPNDGSNGYAPNGGVTLDAAGNLYGTTFYGTGTVSPGLDPGAPPKAGGYGIVFKLTPSQGGTWSESVLHSFTSNPDGASPGFVNLILRKGALYGTTTSGGSASLGTVFKVVP